MNYHVAGVISSAIFLLCLIGFGDQLRFILRRRREGLSGGRATSVLSLNQFASSYLAFLSVFVYGFALERFDHYLVWSRLAAVTAALAILFEIMRDRRDFASRAVFSASAAAFALSLAAMSMRSRLPPDFRPLAQWSVVATSLIIAQGFLQQILAIRGSGHTGAVLLRMHQLTFAKDVGTMVFGFSLGIAAGWPLIITNGVCALLKIGIMWHFRWARLSPVAAARRNGQSPSRAALRSMNIQKSPI